MCAILSEDNRLKLCISDTGIGIPEQRYNQIFKLFHNSNVEGIASHGCGLGLHLSSLIVRELGNSDIKIFSVLGEGTVFAFKIDIDNINSKELEDFDASQEYIESVSPIRIFDLNNSDDCPRVLIVDDNDFNREILSYLLEKYKIKFLESVNGKKAVKLVEKQDKRNMPIKLIIMDISMPVMDGWEATKRIKQLHDEGKTK